MDEARTKLLVDVKAEPSEESRPTSLGKPVITDTPQSEFPDIRLLNHFSIEAPLKLLSKIWNLFLDIMIRRQRTTQYNVFGSLLGFLVVAVSAVALAAPVDPPPDGAVLAGVSFAPGDRFGLPNPVITSSSRARVDAT